MKRAGPDNWFKELAPKNYYAVCYRRKSEALKAFEMFNLHVTEPWRMDDPDCASFDAINERYGLRGKRKACTLARAMWAAMPAGRPYCLDRIDINLLNETTPGMAYGGFLLPDHVIEHKLNVGQERYWREMEEEARQRSQRSQGEREPFDLFGGATVGVGEVGLLLLAVGGLATVVYVLTHL